MVFLTTLTFGCRNMSPGDKGPGNYVKEDREVGSFSAIDIGGAFQVVLTQGNQEKLVLEADADEMQEIITEKVGSKLKIYNKSGWRGNFHNITIYLTFVNLDDISFSGAVEVKSQSPLTFEDLDLDVSGAAEITMDLNAGSIRAEFSGASEVEFTGKCERGTFELSGATELYAAGFQFTNLEIELSGASDAEVFATGDLDIDASGASSVKHKGGAKLRVNTSGSSSIREM
jgi:hypothetical protein